MDRGIKILKSGKSIESNDPDDYIFWSKYQSLPLIDKVEEEFTIEEASCGDSFTHTHNLGFFPLVRVFISSVSAEAQSGMGSSDFLEVPFTTTGANELVYCSSCSFSELVMDNLRITENNISFDYNHHCLSTGCDECVGTDATYKAHIYYYMFELGSELP